MQRRAYANYEWNSTGAGCNNFDGCNICKPSFSGCSVTPAAVAVTLEDDEGDKDDEGENDGAGVASTPQAPVYLRRHYTSSAVLQLHNDAEGWVTPPSKNETDIGSSANTRNSESGPRQCQACGTPVPHATISLNSENWYTMWYTIRVHGDSAHTVLHDDSIVALNGESLGPGARSLLHTVRSLDGVRHAAPRLWQRRGAVAAPSNWLVRSGSKVVSVRARRRGSLALERWRRAHAAHDMLTACSSGRGRMLMLTACSCSTVKRWSTY